MEHKALMFSMCKYLIFNECGLSEQVLMLCKKASDAAQTIHLLALKSHIDTRYDENLGKRLNKQFDILIECEEKYFPMILKQLSGY